MTARWSGERRGSVPRALEVIVCLDDSIIDVAHLVRKGAYALPVGPPDGGHPSGRGMSREVAREVARVDETGTFWVAAGLDPDAPMRELAPGETVTLGRAPLVAFVRETTGGEAAPRAAFRIERRVARVTLASALAHATFLAFLFAVPPDATALVSWERYDRILRSVRVAEKPTEAPRLEAAPGEPSPSGGAGTEPRSEASAAAPGAEGKMGALDRRQRGRTAMRGAHPMNLAGAGDPRARAESSGILGALGRRPFSPTTSEGDAFGAGGVLAYGGDPMADDRDGWGRWGGGWGGTFQGGCPPGATCAAKSIGSGRYTTIGARSGDSPWGQKWGRPDGMPGGPRHDPRAPEPRLGSAVIDPGGLDKEIVRRVVRAHLDEVRHCYERALVGHPDLEGRVVVGFLIQPNGATTAARVVESSVRDEELEGCLIAAALRWAFPSSPSMTRVLYPFELRRTGR